MTRIPERCDLERIAYRELKALAEKSGKWKLRGKGHCGKGGTWRVIELHEIRDGHMLPYQEFCGASMLDCAVKCAKYMREGKL